MKKFFGAFAVSSLIASSAFASPFSDVPNNHWSYNAINDVVQSGIMKGYRGGMFKGKETVNRYEMAIIISRLLRKLEGQSVSSDVRRTMDRLGEEFMDELDLIGARLTALENAFHEHVTEGNDGGANGFNFSGNTRVRWENWNVDQAPAAVGSAKDDFTRTLYRTQLDVEKSVERADFKIQLQHDELSGNRAGGTAIGTNAAGGGDVSLSEAWVNYKIDDKYGVKLGRQRISIGNESMIGNLDWSNTPRSFDGWIWYHNTDDFNYKIWSLELANNGSKIGGGAAAGAGVADAELQGIDLNFDDIFSGDLHVHWYHTNGVVAGGGTGTNAANIAGTVAGFPGAAGTGGLGNSLNTYGFDWFRDYDEWSFYLQYAKQSGDNGGAGAANVDYDGDMWNLSVMYDLDEDDTIGLEYTSYSGDETNGATPGTNYEGFVPLAPTAHKFLGAADVFAQSNIQDITFHWKRDVNERNKFSLAYHWFSLENDGSAAVFLPTGGGFGTLTGGAAAATNPIAGTAAGTNRFDDDLGTELDLIWTHKWSEDVNFHIGYAMFDAGDYFSNGKVAGNGVNMSPDVNFGWITTSVKF